MSSLYKQFETNKDLEIDGISLEYGTNSKGQSIHIKIARAGGSNTKFAKVLEFKFRPYKRALANDQMDQGVAEKLMINAYAEAVILGWSGVEDKEGNELPFSVEAAIKLFTDLPDLFKDVQEQSQKAGLFRADIREVEAKN